MIFIPEGLRLQFKLLNQAVASFMLHPTTVKIPCEGAFLAAKSTKSFWGMPEWLAYVVVVTGLKNCNCAVSAIRQEGYASYAHRNDMVEGLVNR
ncbi:hypothetical protein M5D96_011974 [Drosophila gunungcola]|uniref:Uncharacterized protein n=1 Tax=Drosophila gunungcola TaxID=103775 RepID=A0A9P9YDX6_9MUSC|nr:hypothetical protein M5D96_011974 [Drosophila gunungcola]